MVTFGPRVPACTVQVSQSVAVISSCFQFLSSLCRSSMIFCFVVTKRNSGGVNVSFTQCQSTCTAKLLSNDCCWASHVWVNCRSIKRIDYTGGIHGSSVDGESDYSRSTWLGSAVGYVVCWMHMKFLNGCIFLVRFFWRSWSRRHELYYSSSPGVNAELKALSNPGYRSWCSYPVSLVLHILTTIHANFLHSV